nr:uncharacterized protein LOC109619518 isoform X3 [Crassostrea gigas]
MYYYVTRISVTLEKLKHFHVVLTIFGKMENVKSVCQDILEETVLYNVYPLTMVKDVSIRVTVTSQTVTMYMDVKEFIHRMEPLQLCVYQMLRHCFQ